VVIGDITSLVCAGVKIVNNQGYLVFLLLNGGYFVIHKPHLKKNIKDRMPGSSIPNIELNNDFSNGIGCNWSNPNIDTHDLFANMGIYIL